MKSAQELTWAKSGFNLSKEVMRLSKSFPVNRDNVLKTERTLVNTPNTATATITSPAMDKTDQS